MGLKSSPYQAGQAILVAKEVIKGDRKDPGNAFRWDDVRMNLPGSKEYDPKHPWVSKIRLSDGKIAADLFVYVDDARITGPTEEECWAATRQAASRVNELGIQEAARKRRWPSKKPGAWAGSIVEATEICHCLTGEMGEGQEIHRRNRGGTGRIWGPEPELQTSGEKERLPYLCNPDLSGYGPLPEGNPPDAGQLEIEPRRRWMEAFSEGAGSEAQEWKEPAK